MFRIALAVLVFAGLIGLAGCTHKYEEPQPTEPVMPSTVHWDDAQK